MTLSFLGHQSLTDPGRQAGFQAEKLTAIPPRDRWLDPKHARGLGDLPIPFRFTVSI